MTDLSREISAIPFLDKDLCRIIADEVLNQREHWRHRGTFWTLGASTYNDDVMAYMGIAWQDNAIITRYFGALMQYIAENMPCDGEVIFLHTHGLPGFHIFDQSANGLEGSIHIDQPETRCWWPCKTTDHFTFTVPLMLPQGKGGLNLYEGDQRTIEAHSGDIPKPVYYPYEVGTMYKHDGQTIHQIANPVDMQPGEYRITLQGHGATLVDGRVAVYF